MESQLGESTTLSKKSEREYIILRDSIKGMVEMWKHDTEGLKVEMKKRDEKWKKELDGVGKKYKDLMQNVKDKEKLWNEEFKKVREEDLKMQKDVEEAWNAEIKRLEDEVKKSDTQCEKASKTAR
jgi:predicted patatin/cPLA2 family phospholipase